MKYYADKTEEYFSGWRIDLYRLIRKYGVFNRCFEVGCGSGKLSYELKKDCIVNNATVLEPYGSVLFDELDKKYNCTIEELINSDIKFEKFDLVILGDVLEHTIDPWFILQKISNDYLTEDGYIIISIPIIRNLQSMYKIIFKNSFKYESEGVFDKTHLRFFCIPDVVDLINTSSLRITYMNASFEYRDFKFFSKNRLRILNFLTFGFLKYLIADQVLFVCKKQKI